MKGASAPRNRSKPPGSYRWIVVALLFGAVVISYVDRQTIGLLKQPISESMHWTNTDFANVQICFQVAYAVCYLLWGRFVDRFGARLGLGLAFALWSIAQLGMAGATRIGQFMLARGVLGAGESGAFPATVKAVVEWFPQQERSFATGLINCGSNIGAIITPFFVPFLALQYGWQGAFVATGLLGLAWLPLWLLIYKRPREHSRVSAAELAWIEQDGGADAPRMRGLSLFTMLKFRQGWAFALGKALTDPIFGMYLVWLPDFLIKQHHLKYTGVGWPLLVIYLLSDVGSAAGGWFSSHLLRRGYSVNAARKLTLALCALCALPVIAAPHLDQLWPTLIVIGIAAAAHQGFSSTLFTLPGDLVPRSAVGSLTGLGGLFGAGMGVAMSKFTGYMLDSPMGYAPVFIVAGSGYCAALLVIHTLVPRLQPLREADITGM